MTCPAPEQWELLSMDLLSAAERDRILGHARACAACRAALTAARRDHAALLRTFELFDETHDQQREQLLAALPAESDLRRLRQRGTIMSPRNWKPRWIAATLLPAACVVLLLSLMWTTPASFAFAEVIENLRAARTMVCAVDATIHTEIDATLPQAPGADASGQEYTNHATLKMYADGATRAWLLEDHDDGARELTLPDRMIATDAEGRVTVVKFGAERDFVQAAQSPEVWLERIMALTESPRADLGIRKIDGYRTRGFEIDATRLGMPGADNADAGLPPSVMQIWVDVATRLPVRVDFDVSYRGGPATWRMTGSWTEMEWDIPLDAAQFTPPPDEAVAETHDMQTPAVSEESLLAGLEAYVALTTEVTDLARQAEARAAENPEHAAAAAQVVRMFGLDPHYPTALEPQALMMEVAMRSSALTARAIAQKRAADPDATLSDAERAAIREQADARAGVISAAGLFYQRLVMEERAPAYFGKTVTPGDPDAILLRWTTDDGRSRVVFGDLRIEDRGSRIEE
jgi:hypothetical protein